MHIAHKVEDLIKKNEMAREWSLFSCSEMVNKHLGRCSDDLEWVNKLN